MNRTDFSFWSEYGFLKKMNYDSCVEYLREEGLLEYFRMDKKPEYGIFDEVDPNNLIPLAPEAKDLCRLHKLIRERKVFNVLEFGIGFSTIVMADALEKNYRDYSTDPNAIEVRIKEPFTIYSVDASEHWINEFINKYKNVVPYFNRIKISYSECEIGEYNGQLCHYYTDIPNVITDFVYLDGPSGDDVTGEINGLSFQGCVERTVMSGDLLKMEPTFLPGMMILVDGRTNNARFLSNNFRRKYKSVHDEEQDITVFELLEQPLGKINRNFIDYTLGESYYERLRESR